MLVYFYTHINIYLILYSFLCFADNRADGWFLISVFTFKSRFHEQQLMWNNQKFQQNESVLGWILKPGYFLEPAFSKQWILSKELRKHNEHNFLTMSESLKRAFLFWGLKYASMSQARLVETRICVKIFNNFMVLPAFVPLHHWTNTEMQKCEVKFCQKLLEDLSQWCFLWIS